MARMRWLAASGPEAKGASFLEGQSRASNFGVLRTQGAARSVFNASWFVCHGCPKNVATKN